MQLLAFIKFYDHNKNETNNENFYMEREWKFISVIIQYTKNII